MHTTVELAQFGAKLLLLNKETNKQKQVEKKSTTSWAELIKEKNK